MPVLGGKKEYKYISLYLYIPGGYAGLLARVNPQKKKKNIQTH